MTKRKKIKASRSYKKKTKKLEGKSLIKILIGIGLIIFAVVPTPDDVTVISPILAFTFGGKLLLEGLGKWIKELKK